nr:hypothetical protein [Tanacetum cinerariifolium]
EVEEHEKHLKIILELLKKERFGVHVDATKICCRLNASPYQKLVDERLLLPPKQTSPEVDKKSCTSLLLDLLVQKGYTDERDDVINIVSLRKYSSHDTHFNPLKPMKSKR